MMISPQTYIEGLEGKPYPELIRERDQLIRLLRKFEKAEMAGDRSDPAWMYCPSPEVQYQVHLEYLAALCQMMYERYNGEYVFGKQTLRQDA